MAHLTARRSWLGSVESLSVVHLVIAFAVLTIALGSEWGRIFQGMANAGAEFDAPSASFDLDNAR
jgi:hypothetical protein